MDKVIQMITNGQLTIAVIVSAVAFFLKLLLSSEIDQVFYSRTRQLMTKIIKWIADVWEGYEISTIETVGGVELKSIPENLYGNLKLRKLKDK